MPEISTFETLSAADAPVTAYVPIVDDTELVAAEQNKRMLLSEMLKLFIPRRDYFADLGNKTGATTIDFSSGGPAKKITLTGNVALTFTAPTNAGWCELLIVQDGTGGRTVTFPTMTNMASPQYRKRASSATLLRFFYDGSAWHLDSHTGRAPIVVPTVADLTGLTPADGQIVETLGYLTVGDGGARRLRYAHAGAGTVDGVEIFAAAGGVGRYFAIDLFGSVRPKQGGCVGDGSTNDWTAMVAVVASGLNVIIADGNFKLNDAITLATAGQMISCDGTGSVTQGTDNKNLFEITSDNVTVEEITAYGFGASGDPNTRTDNKFIEAINVENIRIQHCNVFNFAFAGIYLQGCKNCIVSENLIWGSITTSHDSSSDIMTWGTCKNIIIVGNLCLSDSDVGIAVGALQGDANITITANIVCTVNSSGAIIDPSQRRRCIATHYSTDADELNYITVSSNICSGSLNAGIYFNGWGGAIDVLGNVVSNTGINTVDESLSGGISMQGSCRAMLIANNVVSDQLSDAVGCINVYRSTDAGITANIGSLIVTGNVCHDSASFGINVLGTTERCLISDNQVWNVNYHAIFVAGYTSEDTEGLRISHNVVFLDTSTCCGVYMDTQGGTNPVFVHDNSLFYAGTKGTPSANAGIYNRFTNLIAYNNHIKGFDTGIYAGDDHTGRSLNTRIGWNYFEDLDIAIVGRSSSAHAIIVCDPSSIFDNCTLKSDGDTYYDATRWGRIISAISTTLIEIWSNGSPSLGTYVAGDRAFNTSVSAGGWIGTVCTTGGTPGTWKNWGAIAA